MPRLYYDIKYLEVLVAFYLFIYYYECVWSSYNIIYIVYYHYVEQTINDYVNTHG